MKSLSKFRHNNVMNIHNNNIKKKNRPYTSYVYKSCFMNLIYEIDTAI